MIRTTIFFAATLLTVVDLFAHGGRYRGASQPVSIDPGSGPKPPEPVPPPPPRPVVPPPIYIPGQVTPKKPGPRTPRGVDLGPDLTQWQNWWEMNKDQFLLIKQAVRQGGPVTGGDDYYLGPRRRPVPSFDMAPGPGQVSLRIQPSLHRALLATNNPDLVTACLLALAKVGTDHQDFRLLEVLSRYLPANHIEIRETAALALGVTRRPEALPLLRDILLDTDSGRRLVERREVDSRMRSFAAFGIGILAAHGDADLRSACFAALAEMFEKGHKRDRDILVAVINGIGVLGLDAAQYSKDKRVLWQALPMLKKFYGADLGRTAQVVQAHVPVAIGRILGRGDSADHRRYRELFAAELTRTKGRTNEMVQSAAIALGLLSEPQHAEISQLLHDYCRSGVDQQARYFSMIALGEIGGEANRTRLLQILSRGKKALERPWAALALGVLSYRARTASGGAVDVTVGIALEDQLRSVKNMEASGAFAVGLGLSGYIEGAESMRSILAGTPGHDEFRGFLCLGLALVGDGSAVGLIRSVLDRSARRPHALRQSAIALGRLQDRRASLVLLEMIQDGESSTARLAAVAGALQFIGDRRTVDGLVAKLDDQRLSKLARAFVATALGGIADPMLLPFNARYAQDSNYRAAVPTLTDQATGILDLL